MQNKIDDLNRTSKKVGLGIHTIKSEVMKNSKVAETGVSLKGNPLEMVDIFCYSVAILRNETWSTEPVEEKEVEEKEKRNRK